MWILRNRIPYQIHASNYVGAGGNLNEDIPRMLGELEEAKEEQRYRLRRVAETYLKTGELLEKEADA